MLSSSFSMPCFQRVQITTINLQITHCKINKSNKKVQRMVAKLFLKGLFKVPCCIIIHLSWSHVQCSAAHVFQSLDSTGRISRQDPRQTCLKCQVWLITCRLRPLRLVRSWPVERRWQRLRPSVPVALPAASEATPAAPTLPAAVGP